jgi:hypothetical protein
MIKLSFVDAMELISEETELDSLIELVEEARGWLVMRRMDDSIRDALYKKLDKTFKTRYELIVVENITHQLGDNP